MTIAICAVIPEGVVIGADSTSTRTSPDGAQRYLDSEQKVFEVGEQSTLGIVTWGLGQIGDVSHQTRVAVLADDLAANAPQDVGRAASRFAGQLWADYQAALGPVIVANQALLTDQNTTQA